MTTIRVNLRNSGISQLGYPAQFNSFAIFQGIPLGASPDGVFRMDGGPTGGIKDIFTTTTDDRSISAWFELPESPLDNPTVKQGRRLYISGKFGGSMSVKVNTPKGTQETNTYTATPRDTSFSQHTFQVPLSSKQRGEYWGFTVSNVNGSDFSVDAIDGVFIYENRRAVL